MWLTEKVINFNFFKIFGEQAASSPEKTRNLKKNSLLQSMKLELFTLFNAASLILTNILI